MYYIFTLIIKRNVTDIITIKLNICEIEQIFYKTRPIYLSVPEEKKS